MASRTLGAGFVLLALFLGSAQAVERMERGGMPEEEELPRHSCYRLVYVPALYLVNTRGKLLEPERVVSEGQLANGQRIHERRIPATYLKTRKLLQEDHYTLNRIPCRY